MTVNRHALEMFLSVYATNQTLVKPAMKELEPFFLLAEKGAYHHFASGNKELRAEAAKAIGKVLDIPAPKVVFVSPSHSSHHKLGWMSREEFDAGLWANSENNLVDSLSINFTDYLRAMLGNSLWESLWEPIGRSGLFTRSLWNGLNDATLWSGLTYSLFYYLGFTIIGEREKTDRFVPLIRLLPKAIPLSKKVDEPNTWFVCVA